MKKTLTTALSIVFVLGLMAGPALANGPTLERGNWLSGQATPVDLTSEDVTIQTLNGTEYVTVNHGIATDFDGYQTLVQREPVRYQQNVVTRDLEADENYDAAWLGIAGPLGPEIPHQGTLTWYYEVDEGEWVSLTFQFDGEGNLLHVNDVTPE